MRFEIERCRELYRSADVGIALLPDRSARCVGAAHDLYGRILDRIEAQHYDVFTERASVSTPRRRGSWPPASLVRPRRCQPVRDGDGRGACAWPRVTRQRSTAAAMIATPLARRGGGPAPRACRRSWSWRWRPRPRPTPARGGERRAPLTALRCRGRRPPPRSNAIGTRDRRAVRSLRATPARCARRSPACPRSCRWPGSSMAVPAREAAHAALGPRSTPASRVVVGAVALTAWDLFLDPQMVGEGYWRWARRGRLPRHPARQLRRLVRHRPRRDGHARGVAGRRPVDAATSDGPTPRSSASTRSMGVMETIGFAAFFRDRSSPRSAASAMLPIAAAAIVRRTRRDGRRR